MKKLCNIIFTLIFFLLSVKNLAAVEPDSTLFTRKAEVREARYREKAQQLAGQMAAAVDEGTKQSLALQQQLLTKLQTLPEIPGNQATDLRFSDPTPETGHSWDDFQQFLDRFISVTMEAEVAERNLEDTDKQQQSLYNKLIALDDQSGEQDILQLQYAYQVMKSDQQKLMIEQLKEGLGKANELFPALLQGVRIDSGQVEKQLDTVALAKEKLERQKELLMAAAAGDDAQIEQQESVLAGYLGRELAESDKKLMHYETLRLLEQKIHRLTGQIRLVGEDLNLHGQKQKALWYSLLTAKPNFFSLADEAGDLKNLISGGKKLIEDFHSAIYGYEKELANLRGANGETGPKAKELIVTLDKNIQEIFTQVSGMGQQADLFLAQGRLLEKGIGLKQSALGAVVTKTRDATDDIVETALAALNYPLLAYSGMSVSLLLVLEVVALLLLGIVGNRLFDYMVLRTGRKRNWSERTVHLVQAGVKYPLIVIVAMIILSVVGINTRSLALVAGALSLGIGFGMQTIVNNLVSGIILLFDKSIRPGDFISLGGNSEPGGFRGNVVQMNIRATVLRTNDNINIIIPNADLMASQVVNWTYADDKVRFRVPFAVAYGTDIDQVKTLIGAALLDLAMVLPQPEPEVWMTEHAESSLAFVAAIWVQGQSARQPARTFDAVLTLIYKTLTSHGIEIPFPQVDLRLRSAEPPGHSDTTYNNSNVLGKKSPARAVA